MTGSSFEELRRDSFRLFEEGNYADSLALCRAAGTATPDPQLAILAARNLFNLGRFDEAETDVRDLIQKMPESSYLHSFLGRILEERHDDTAISEHARAVLLDPTNQEALRSYAAFLVAAGDHRMAVPALKKLVALSGREDDTRSLIRALTASGQGAEALALFSRDARRREEDYDLIAALMGAGRYQEAAREAVTAYRVSGKLPFARIYLRARALADPETAAGEYREYFSSLKDPGIGHDYALLLRKTGRAGEALGLCLELLDAGGMGPDYSLRLLTCQLNADLGEKERASGCYEHLVRDALQNLDDREFLTELLAAYRGFLLTYHPVREAESRFLSILSSHPQLVSLLSIARLYEDIGDLSEARAYSYRAFRSDFLQGGMAYARFLASQNEFREAEKVLLYVLNNARRTREIESVAGLVLDDQWKLYRRPRLLERLVAMLGQRFALLSSDGLEYLAVACLVSAGTARRENDFLRCKEFCLRGLDAVPAIAHHIRPADFLELIQACKEEGVCDPPVMSPREDAEKEGQEHTHAIRKFIENCDDQERRILEYLIEHQEASEIELRRLLNTRRVVGIMNRIMQKAAASDIALIEKKGVGEGGEVYAYIAG
jgi:tetratricopeptide (TPR) repeat protein